MGTTLTGTTPQDTYDSLIKVTDNGPLSGTAKYLSDGLGNDSVLALSTSAVGIGTTNPAHKLAISSATDADLMSIVSSASANQTILRFGIDGNDANITASGGSVGNLVFKTYGSERMRITSAGSVLVGTSSSDLTRNMIVAGTAGMAVQYAGNAGTYFDIAPAAANGAVTLTADARTGAYPDMIFRTSAAEQVRITSGGVLQLTQGQIKFPATQVPSADANTLDDYEEGTWTPFYAGGITGATYANSVGKYTKIGRVVHWSCRVQATAGTAIASALTIGGFPFTNSATVETAGSIGYFTLYTTDSVYMYNEPSTTAIAVFYNFDGTPLIGTELTSVTGTIHCSGTYFV